MPHWSSYNRAEINPTLTMFVRTFLIFVVSVLLPLTVNAYDPAKKIVAAKGSMPLILTVPHDGGEFLGLTQNRSDGESIRDLHTRKLAENVVKLIEKKTGKRPYIVVAKFSRTFLDANRAENKAMDSPRALPAYLAYHGRIASFVAEVKNLYPDRGLLIDIHGQGAVPDMIFRGTRSGKTTKFLIDRHGRAALQGERSIIGLLAAKGYHVYPDPGTKSLKEDRRFRGGYTVRTYGSNNKNGIDAIQLEFGKTPRANPRLAEDLADAILDFMREYSLLPPESARKTSAIQSH